MVRSLPQYFVCLCASLSLCVSVLVSVVENVLDVVPMRAISDSSNFRVVRFCLQFQRKREQERNRNRTSKRMRANNNKMVSWTLQKRTQATSVKVTHPNRRQRSQTRWRFAPWPQMRRPCPPRGKKEVPRYSGTQRPKLP